MYQENLSFDEIVEIIKKGGMMPLEEAMYFRDLNEKHGLSQTQISEIIFKSRSYVANSMRLLKVPESVQQLVRDGKLSPAHIRPLASHPDPEAAAALTVENNWSVEKIIQKTQKHFPEIEKIYNSESQKAFALTFKTREDMFKFMKKICNKKSR